jgi:ERCC4-type nuclease
MNRFPTTKSSLAISIVDNIQDDFGRAVDRINNIQRSKSNHFAIVVFPDKQYSLWTRYQYAIQPGDTKLIRANNMVEVVEILHSIVTLFSDTSKLQAQEQYIQHEKLALESMEASRNIFASAIGKLGLNLDEQSLLMESVGSIANVMMASKDSLEMNCPIDIEHINRISDFFGAKANVDGGEDMDLEK